MHRLTRDHISFTILAAVLPRYLCFSRSMVLTSYATLIHYIYICHGASSSKSRSGLVPALYTENLLPIQPRTNLVANFLPSSLLKMASTRPLRVMGRTASHNVVADVAPKTTSKIRTYTMSYSSFKTLKRIVNSCLISTRKKK